MPDCALLFSEPDQQIHRLNPSGAVVAARLQHEATLGELVSELLSHGLEPEKSRAWAIDLLARLAEASLLETRVPPGLARVERSQTLQIAGLNFELGFSSEDLFRLLGSAYGPLPGETATPDHKYHIIDAGDFVLLGRDLIQLAQVVDRPTAAVRLKGAILEDVLNGPGHVAALHGACVARGKGAILLLGPPGTGKTTITLALLKHGFGYGSDDVTLVSRSGGVRTVPLPPAVKEGAWSIVERLGFSLTDLPIHSRPDGQRVRFLPLAGDLPDPSITVSAIVRLNREPGRDAVLEPLSREEALTALFEESRSVSGRCSKQIMRALAQLVRQAECFQLNYAEAADAAGVVDRYDSASHAADV